MAGIVVLPLDRSDAALLAAPVAMALAGGLGVGLRLMTTSFETDPEPDLRFLHGVADQLGLAHSSCELVSDQFPAQAIVQAAQRPGVEAVCMATYAHGVVPHTLGGIADEVVHDTGAPIVLVGPSFHRDAQACIDGPLVVAVDGSDAAASVLPLVARWSAQFEVAAHITTVDGPDSSGCAQALLSSAEELVARTNPRVSVHRLGGRDVAGALLEFAASVDAGLLALAPTGHGGAMNRALGFVATDLVQRSAIPVVVRRATGSER